MRKLLTIFLLFFACSIQALEIESILKEISKKEQRELERFFKNCISLDHFGYTIFFDKPVSVAGFFLKCPKNEIANPKLNALLHNDWNVWKKYEHLFPHNNFIFCEEIKEFYDEECKCIIETCHIFLVNKAALLSLLHSKKAIFQEYLGSDFSPENLLSKIEAEKTVTPHLLHHEGLLGIVLGYGTEAAFRFAEIIKKDSPPQKTDSWCPITFDRPKGCKIAPVVFMGNIFSIENQTLKKQYESQIFYIDKSYRDKNFLVQVLAFFANDTSQK